MKFKEKGDYSNMSQGAIAILTQRGKSLTDIAKMLGVTKSFISRVRSGQRSFTLDHLAKLQAATGDPIPLLMIEAIPRSTVSRQLRPAYDTAIKMLREMADPDAYSASSRRGKTDKRLRSTHAKAA